MKLSITLIITTILISLIEARLPTLLVYSKTVGYRHDSIPTALQSIKSISINLNINTTCSEDETLFSSPNNQLAQFDMIAFLSNSNNETTGEDVLTNAGVVAFNTWLTSGGSLIGLHAGTACLFKVSTFGVALGSWFDYHPTISNASFTKLISHPTIDMLPSPYNTYEEVYNFRTDPRSVNATILLSVDPSSYSDPLAGTTGYYQGAPHPIAWFRESSVDLSNGTGTGIGIMRGRMWYTSLGHTNETWRSSVHIAHVQAGILWVVQGLSITNSTTTSGIPVSSVASKTITIGSISSSNALISSTSSTTSNKSTNSATSTSTSSAIRINSSYSILIFILVLAFCQI